MLFDIDAAAISLVFDGTNSGTLGSSGAPAPDVRRAAVPSSARGPASTPSPGARRSWFLDLAHPDDQCWPIYGPAMLDLQVHGVYAMPIVVAGEYVGALDFFRTQPGLPGGEEFSGAIVAAELAGIPVLDLLDADMQAAVGDPDSNAWAELNALSRAEVSQATGMLVAQLEIEPAEALVRLRAHAYSTGRSATEVARDIVERRLRLEAD